MIALFRYFVDGYIREEAAKKALELGQNPEEYIKKYPPKTAREFVLVAVGMRQGIELEQAYAVRTKQSQTSS